MIAVVAPSDRKAKIIMRYFIEHIGDNIMFYSLLEKNTRLERLRQEESKERITLRNGGTIYVLSAQSGTSKSIEAAMGEGAEIVIEDEACLIDDDTEATIFRMGAGKTMFGVSNFFYCKIGNPFFSVAPNSHFKVSWDDPNVQKIFIDAALGLKEGRYTQEFLDEAKKKPLYSILYDCEFPDENELDKDGYRQLVVSDDIRYVENVCNLGHWTNKKRLGFDIGAGGDPSKAVLRIGYFAAVVGTLKTKDTMANVPWIEELQKKYGVRDEDVSIDDIGIGRGVSDRCAELGHSYNAVSVGDPADDSETFANLKAELSWKAKNWIEGEGRFEVNSDWIQGTWIKYKQQSGDKKVIIEPKERLKKKRKKSPDTWDAFVLTFFEPQYIGII